VSARTNRRADDAAHPNRHKIRAALQKSTIGINAKERTPPASPAFAGRPIRAKFAAPLGGHRLSGDPILMKFPEEAPNAFFHLRRVAFGV
jgi:hypothetical protein